MDNTTVIQVRLPSELRDASEKRAGEVGLSSVQEAIRLFLHGFVTKRIGLGVVAEKYPAEEVTLSRVAKKRYQRMEKDLDDNKNTVVFDEPEEALTWLTEPSK